MAIRGQPYLRGRSHPILFTMQGKLSRAGPSSRGPRRLKVFANPGPMISRRWLVPVYRFKALPMAWACAVCGKLFSRTVEEAQQATSPLPPDYIYREFEIHNCELYLRHFPDPDI